MTEKFSHPPISEIGLPKAPRKPGPFVVLGGTKFLLDEENRYVADGPIVQAYVSTKEVAKFLGIHAGTLDNWRWEYRQGKPYRGPPFEEIYGLIRYPVLELLAWLANRRVLSTTTVQ